MLQKLFRMDLMSTIYNIFGYNPKFEYKHAIIRQALGLKVSIDFGLEFPRNIVRSFHFLR